MVGVLSCTVCGGQQVVEEPRALRAAAARFSRRSEEHTSELQSRSDLVCRLLLEKKKKKREIKSRAKQGSTNLIVKTKVRTNTKTKSTSRFHYGVSGEKVTKASPLCSTPATSYSA